MAKDARSARGLLDAAYEDLNFTEGELLPATDRPNDVTPQRWIEKGDWLSLAKKVEADKVFFIENNPVIVFAECKDQDDAARQKFNEIWCMARPMFLFLACEGKLAVHNLAKPPVRTPQEWSENAPELDAARTIQEVVSELHKYRREQVESGKLFEDERFGKADQRADGSLINNLKLVRKDLRAAGLDSEDLKYAHALIGRSIFIRYLEDRGVLIDEYFKKVAQGNRTWERLLQTQPNLIDIDPRMDNVLYFRVLHDKDFTYALFDQLASDFNGDMFPSDHKEKKKVKQEHLDLLRKFLQGQAGQQKNLFFWAYRFDIIPIELISSIYEEFYHVENEKKDGKGTHYTPSSLVDVVVSQTLTPERLSTDPRVIDVACGSGIFLVESFRRIVRYHIQRQNGRRLNFQELQEILRKQIAGIDINKEAVRVAAFSLYLALLHYQEPPDILRQIALGHRLPYLIYEKDSARSDRRFNCLLGGVNAFEVESKVADEEVRRSFTSNCAHVVLGNPPWGSPPTEDTEGVAAMKKALEWCDRHHFPVSDKERSQAFIWRSLDLLRNGGVAGLLVSTGVLYKKQLGSQDFRKTWLKAVKLESVINCAHVRDVFFKGPNREVDAISPFASIVFTKEIVNSRDHLVEYWSAKKTAQAERLQAIVLSQPDLHLIPQDDLRRNSDLWKIYWWGSHHDAALISSLETLPRLKTFYDPSSSGQGFSSAKKGLEPTPAEVLKYDQLAPEKFQRYGPLDKDLFTPVPRMLYRFGKLKVYEGTRLLIKHGITQASENKGQIIARVETEPFAFSNSINGIKLPESAQEWEYKVLLGILWSSLIRYYFFLTASKWGMWHFGIHKKEYLNLPITLPDGEELRDRIVGIVEQLRAWNPAAIDLFNSVGDTQAQREAERTSLEYLLDEAIFDLYKLSESERDLVRDLCDIGIEFFYHSFRSDAVKPIGQRHFLTSGTHDDLPPERNIQTNLESYLHTFLKIWDRELPPESEFRWRVIQPDGDSPLLAVIFATEEKDGPVTELAGSDREEWLRILRTLETDLLFPYNSKHIYIDGMVRAVTDTSGGITIIIIKRNERRLWTRSMARDDVEATLLQAMNLQDAGRVFSERTSSPHQRTPVMG